MDCFVFFFFQEFFSSIFAHGLLKLCIYIKLIVGGSYESIKHYLSDSCYYRCDCMGYHWDLQLQHCRCTLWRQLCFLQNYLHTCWNCRLIRHIFIQQRQPDLKLKKDTTNTIFIVFVVSFITYKNKRKTTNDIPISVFSIIYGPAINSSKIHFPIQYNTVITSNGVIMCTFFAGAPDASAICTEASRLNNARNDSLFWFKIARP